MFLDPIREGAARAGRDIADLDLTVAVGVEFTDDLGRARLRLYRDVGITTLRANLHGGADADRDRQLGDLERLLDLVREINDETGVAIG